MQAELRGFNTQWKPAVVSALVLINETAVGEKPENMISNR